MKINIILLFIIFLLSQNTYSGEIKGVVKTSEGGIVDAVVYIEKIDGKTFTPPKTPAKMDQVDLMFVPHVLPVLVGTTVDFPNSDATRHSVFTPSKITKFDLGTYSPGSSKSVIFEKPGVIPLLCHVHPEMSSFIVVLETPYFAVTNDKGNYLIKNVPPGKYRLTVWHEWAKGKTQQIEITGKQTITINFSLEE